MSESDREHYTDSYMYIIEQTCICCLEAAKQFFKNNNIPITYNEFIALDTIIVNDGICQIDLAKLILKDRSFTSRVIDSLEERGMVERRSETKNKKLVKNVYITEKGKGLINHFSPILRKMAKDLFNEVPREEIDTMKETLLKIKDYGTKIVTMKI